MTVKTHRVGELVDLRPVDGLPVRYQSAEHELKDWEIVHVDGPWDPSARKIVGTVAGYIVRKCEKVMYVGRDRVC